MRPFSLICEEGEEDELEERRVMEMVVEEGEKHARMLTPKVRH